MTMTLEPCPFCGSTDVEVYPANREYGRWNVCCGNPGCVTRGDNDYLLERDAVSAWNRRAIDPHLGGAGESVATLHLQLSRWDVTGIRAAIQRLPCPSGEYPLYITPQPNIDVQAVREVISELRKADAALCDEPAGKWADKLEEAVGGKHDDAWHKRTTR